MTTIEFITTSDFTLEDLIKWTMKNPVRIQYDTWGPNKTIIEKRVGWFNYDDLYKLMINNLAWALDKTESTMRKKYPKYEFNAYIQQVAQGALAI